MDVVINSQIQSPLVRTLARTKGKSQSFTHNIADNVAPCSFTKIQLTSQNQGETQFGRNYKLKIPQYGYLRDVILKYTTQENTIDAKVIEVVKPLYTHYYTALEDVRAAGSYCNAGDPDNTTTLSIGVTVGPTRDRACDLTWYNLQNVLRQDWSNNGYGSNVMDLTAQTEAGSILAPQFPTLIIPTGTITGIQGNNGYKGLTGTNVCAVSGSTAPVLGVECDSVGQAGAAGPYTQLLKLNGTPAMWSAHLRLYYGIYQLAKQVTYPNGVQTYTYPLAKMVWDALLNEPVQSMPMDLYSANGVTAPATYSEDTATVTATTGTLANVTAANIVWKVTCTLPRTVVGISRAGQTFWIPKLPQFRFDANGTIIGVDFVPLHLLHPNDNADSIADIALISKLSSDATKSSLNYRQFPFGAAKAVADDWAPWDWQTEAFYYQGIAANVAERVQLSTHNRPIQTIFPQETYARIQQFQPAERQRYLKMMQARISTSGKATGDANGKAGEKSMYFPLFLASTENPSLNFDTRFVEQLDIDVMTNSLDKVFTASDVVQQKSTLLTIAGWIDLLRTSVFDFNWKSAAGAIQPVNTAATGVYTVYSDPAAVIVRNDLSASGALNDKPASYAIYNAATPRSLVLSLRSFQTVPRNYIKVEALCYFHNFHDSTSQAIRDSNFKPGTPASLLMYNTYMETVRPIKLSELQATTSIQALITTNNLVFGTTFFIRRRSVSPLLSNKRDHYMQTLPIKEVSLTASGQQIYNAVFDEAQLTDVFDHDLASGKLGRKYDRRLIAQAIDDPITGESFYVYHIPYGFSSDMTYNSGSIAFQTLNNPVLNVTIDVGSGASRPFEVTGDPAKEEFELVIMHNYFNMMRIDSNTGAITRSLDL